MATGKRIHIDPKTVEKHKGNLYRKAGSGSNVNLIVQAFKNELVDLHSSGDPGGGCCY